MADWPSPDRATVFLDFDGTLVDIAPTPDSIEIPDAVPDLLSKLMSATGNRVLLLTGRDVRAVLGFLPSFEGHILGCHGAERWDGSAHDIIQVDAARLSTAAEHARASALADAGMLVEAKPTGLVLHYRANPTLQRDVRILAQELCAALDGFTTLSGKMSVEIRPEGIGKENALADLMRNPPFDGTTPLFFGDDETDLPALRHVQREGGVAGYIGESPAGITLSYPSPTALRQRLFDWVTHGG